MLLTRRIIPLRELHYRLNEISFREQILGRYSGLLSKCHSEGIIPREYFMKELEFIRDCLIRVKGLDCEDINVLNQQIEYLIQKG